MRNNFLAALAMVCLAALAAGCYTSPDGINMGMPLVKDTIVGRYEFPYERVKGAVLTVLKRSGTITNDDLVTKVIQARVDGNRIWVTMDDSEPRVVKIVIQARSAGGSADVDLASEIDKQVYGELITGGGRR